MRRWLGGFKKRESGTSSALDRLSRAFTDDAGHRYDGDSEGSGGHRAVEDSWAEALGELDGKMGSMEPDLESIRKVVVAGHVERRRDAARDESDSTSLQRECAARARSGKRIRASRPRRETIARPKMSRK